MAVSYMRPFTSGAWKLPGKYVPRTSPDSDFHRGLEELRKKVYAHSDKESGRSAYMRTTGTSGDIVSMEYGSEWLAFPVQDLPAVLAFFHDQRERFLTDAASIHVDLEADDESV